LTISREQAFQIATDNLHWRKDEAVRYSVYEVVAWDEITCRRPSAYNVAEESWRTGWIAYLDDGSVAIRSSVVMLIDKSTGRLVYFGTANDEG
jgi:hypothetical protein